MIGPMRREDGSTATPAMEEWIRRTSTAISPNIGEDLAQEARILLWREYRSYHEHAVKRPLRLRMMDLTTGRRGWTGEDRPRRFGRMKELATPLPEAAVDRTSILETRIVVRQAIAKLTPNERRFIWAKYYERMSWSEIEREFGYHPSPVWASARNKLRAELADLRGVA